MADKGKAQVVDAPEVGAIYCSKMVSMLFDGSAVTLTFGEMRFTPKETGSLPQQGEHPHAHVTARIALSPAAAVELVNMLTNLVKTFSRPTDPKKEN